MTDFQAFTAQLPAIRAAHPNAIDCTRTRLHDIPPPALLGQAKARLQLPAQGHRCHIATAWHARLGWPGLSSTQILVSQGVRQSLAWLMRQWASQRCRVALPQDVYPVYAHIAQQAGVQHSHYALHPCMRAPLPIDADVLLITNPVKPRGSHLSDAELQHVLHWLRAAPTRRVVIDAVYDLAPALNTGTQALFATGQALVLHSLSKAWLSPLLAGVILLPNAQGPGEEQTRWRDALRSMPPDRQALAQAQAWLQQQNDFPAQVGLAFECAWQTLHAQAQARGLPVVQATGPAAPNYMLTLNASFETALQAGFLGLPDTIFGGPGRGQTILSALAWV